MHQIKNLLGRCISSMENKTIIKGTQYSIKKPQEHIKSDKCKSTFIKYNNQLSVTNNRIKKTQEKKKTSIFGLATSYYLCIAK